MLKWISIFCFNLCVIIGGNAQDTLKIIPQTSTEKEEPVQKISIDDLPEIVKEKISGEQYRGWILKAAYKTLPLNPDKTKTDSVDYIVELIKEKETIRVRFDGNGYRTDD